MSMEKIINNTRLNILMSWLAHLYDVKQKNRHYLGKNLKVLLNEVYHNDKLCAKYPEILSFFGQRENMGKPPIYDDIIDDEFYLVLPYVIPKEISEEFQGKIGFICNLVDKEILEVQDALEEHMLREKLYIDEDDKIEL